MTTRRGFLTGMLALGAAPTIVRAESLMRLWVPPQNVLTLDMLPDEMTFYDDVMLRQIGKRMALVREMIIYGALKL